MYTTLAHSSSQPNDHLNQDMMGPPAYLGCYLIGSHIQQDQPPLPQNEETPFDMRHYAHPYRMCNSLCARSPLHEAYSYIGYTSLQGGTCICSNSLPNENDLLEDAHCRERDECAEQSSKQCSENNPRLVHYWTVPPENQPNRAVSLDRPISIQRKMYNRGINRRSLLRSVIARDVSEPLDQVIGEPDQITTGSSKSFDPSPNSIFSDQSLSQTSRIDPVPIVAVAMACISLGLGIFCLFIAFNRLKQLRRHKKENPDRLLPDINNNLECANKLTRKESSQEELAVNIQPLSAHRPKQLLMPSQHYRQTTRAGFSPMTNFTPGLGTLKDGVRTGKASYVTQHGEFPHEMNAKEFIESQFSPNDFKDVSSIKKPFEIEGDHLKPLRNRRILDIQASHTYRNQTGNYDYFGSNANQERNYPPKVDLLPSPTNYNLALKSSEFVNARNVCGTGSVVSPEKLARESYPHPNIVPSGTKASSITPITRNSWMMKHSQSLKLKESITNYSPNSSSEPQPVRKLKSSFGVGLETDRLDMTPDVPDEVEKSLQLTDSFNLGFSLYRNQSCVSTPDIIDSGRSENAPGNRLTQDLDGNKRFSSSSRLATIESPTVTSHCTRSDSNSNHLPFPSSQTTQSNKKHFLNQSTPYPSLGLTKLTENDSSFNQYSPVKSTPKMNGLLNFGSMLSNFTHSPSSKSKIDVSTETNLEEDFKRPSTYVPPKINWSRRRKILSGNWKRLNSVTTSTTSPLTSSISSDALSQGYLKKGTQTHSDLNHSLKACDDSTYELRQERLRNRHKYSKSVPDMSFLTQLHSDDEIENEPKQLNIMNPDQPSLSESTRSLSPCELQKERKLNSTTKFEFHSNVLGNHSNSEDYSTLSSSSGETAIKKLQTTNSIQMKSPNLNRFENHLGYEEFKSQLGILDYKESSVGGYCRKSDPILYGKWSEAIELYRQKHSISSKSCGNLLSKALFQTSEKKMEFKVRKPTLEIQTEFLKNETLNNSEYQSSPSKNQACLHPIYNLPISSRPDHSKSIDKSETTLNSINQTKIEIVSNQTLSQESSNSAQPERSTTISAIHKTNPNTPINSNKLNQELNQNHQKEEDELIPFFSRSRSNTSILKLTGRHLSLGENSNQSSEDLSSFCTGAASLNSEPQWKSRLNSAGSFATNQSFEEQPKLWVANPDRFYSPSLESIFHPPSRLSLSPVPNRSSGSLVNC